MIPIPMPVFYVIVVVGTLFWGGMTAREHGIGAGLTAGLFALGLYGIAWLLNWLLNRIG